MSQGPTQWQLERLESRMVLCHTREKKAASCFPGSAGGSGGQTYPLVFFFFTRRNTPHDILFAREPWTCTEVTLRKELAAVEPTQPTVLVRW